MNAPVAAARSTLSLLRQILLIGSIVLGASVGFTAILSALGQVNVGFGQAVLDDAVPFALLVPLVAVAYGLWRTMQRAGDSLLYFVCGSALVAFLPMTVVFLALDWYLWAWCFMPADYTNLF